MSEHPDKAEAAGEHAGQEELTAAFYAFVSADTWTASREVLAANPKLTSDEADQLIGALVVAASEQGAEDAAKELRTYRVLLRRCRDVGPDVAFAEIVESSSALSEINQLLEPLEQVLEASDQPRSASSNVAAMNAARQLVGHPGLHSLPDTARGSVLNLAAMALLHSYEAAGSVADLDDALAAWDEALLITSPGSPDRPGILNDRADGLVLRYARTGSVADLDDALVAWNDALAVTPPDSPDRPGYLSNRATGLATRYARTNNLADLDAALADMEEALTLAPADSPDRPGLLNNRATGLWDRYARAGDVADLDDVLAAWNEALGLLPPHSPDRPRYLSNRASGLSTRYARTGNVADLDAALADMEAALALTPAGSPDRPGLLSNRANDLSDRYARTGNVADLDAALADMEAALALTPAGSPDRPGRLSNRATGLSDRYARTGNVADLDAALADWDEALGLAPGDSHERPTILSNHASGLTDRAIRTHSVADLDAALTNWREALALTPAGSPDRPTYLNNRASGLSDRFARTGDVADLDAALADWDEAVALTPSGSPERPVRISNRAYGLWTRYARTGDVADLDCALTDWDEAVALTPANSPDQPGILKNRAQDLSTRHALTGSVADRDAAVTTYREACATGLELHPEAAVVAARSWSRWATERTAWTEASEAGSYGLQAADRLVRIQSVRTDKESRLRDAQGLASLTAYAWAKLGDGKQAVVAAERGRAVLLAEALTIRATLERLTGSGHDDLRKAYEWASMRLADPSILSPSDEAHLGGHRPDVRLQAQADLDGAIAAIRAVPEFEGFLVQPSDEEVFAQATAAASDGALVYVMAAAPGGMILTVQWDGTAGITELPELSESALSHKVSSYFEAYGSFRAGHGMPGWPTVLDETTRWLWASVGGPLYEALEDVGITRATLVPMGALGLLPLHAAWVEDASRETGRRYLMDDVCITYAPSAESLVSARVAVRGEVGSILAVDEPWPVLGSPLLGSELEVAAAVASFPGKATVLRHHNATRRAVLESLAGHAVVHLSCHGIANPDRPLESQLLMAFDEPITLADLLDSRLDDTRLLVLSACETALPGAQLIDEVVSLPAGLLQAGAAAAIGSLWSVEDLATMALLCRFYQLWRNEDQPPAEALRQAQSWLRDLTREERAAVFPGIDFTGSGESGPRPYANPFWWAAFGLTGA
jgi:CHAT domain-containing protein